jgi:16S rRNA pseudouridine516 synthase
MAKVPTSRADKLLSTMGYGLRKDIARMAKAGGIVLDGANLLDVTRRIPAAPDLPSRMQIDGAALGPLAGMVILLNKPLGLTCSHKEYGPFVHDILPERWRQRGPAISTVGRLDKQASGLLLLTDDGNLLPGSSVPGTVSGRPIAPGWPVQPRGSLQCRLSSGWKSTFLAHRSLHGAKMRKNP